MKTKRIGDATLYLGTMEETIGEVKADHILTDPPYLYIKTHDFDKEFDEQLLFEQAKRMLPDNGFIALFGRGTSFYRWNTRLADLGFVFKEEIVWDKRYTTTPCCNISRVHETISLHSRKGKIRRSKVPYIEQKEHDISSIIVDIKRLKTAFNNTETMDGIIKLLKTGILEYKKSYKSKYCLCVSKESGNADRACLVMHSIIKGMNEKSIIFNTNNRRQLQHPTEKPVRLAERILALISNEGDTIYDPFMGSGSFGVACINTGRKYIGSEMKKEYFDIACKRIEEAVKAKQNELFKEVS